MEFFCPAESMEIFGGKVFKRIVLDVFRAWKARAAGFDNFVDNLWGGGGCMSKKRCIFAF